MKPINDLLNDPRRIFVIHGVAATVFFVGFTLVNWADGSIAPSLQQELVALLGLLLIVMGFGTAVFTQLVLIYSRLKGPGRSRSDNEDH